MADTTAFNGNPNPNPSVQALKDSELVHTRSFRSPDQLTIPPTDATAAYNTVANGPVAQNVLDQSAKTSAEMGNLAAARQTPNYRAATGQPLTHYHSFFSELLSWRNPRASAIAYASLVTLIFSVRYLDVVRWGFKLTWMVLGITIAAEIAGKALLNNGFATQLRPRKYYTVPRETLDSLIGDVHELINFFVIESQRVLFAENVYASAAAALAAFISYYLVKIVPYWGLAVIATTVVFFTPLIYTSNQELIDTQLKHAGEVVNAQTAQLRSVAQKHTEQATHLTKQYMGDYTAKAQALIKGGARQTEEQLKQKTPRKAPEIPSTIKATDFPSAPKETYDFPAAPKEDFQFASPDAKFEPELEPKPKTKPELASKSEAEPLIIS